jgi:hypothetical protein
MSTFRSVARIAAEAAELLDPDWFGQLHDLPLAEQHPEEFCQFVMARKSAS